jgi:hypothetical protein
MNMPYSRLNPVGLCSDISILLGIPDDIFTECFTDLIGKWPNYWEKS